MCEKGRVLGVVFSFTLDLCAENSGDGAPPLNTQLLSDIPLLHRTKLESSNHIAELKRNKTIEHVCHKVTLVHTTCTVDLVQIINFSM